MISSNTIKNFRNRSAMYPSGRKRHCNHRINFVNHDSVYEDDYDGETGPIVPHRTIYVHSGIFHPINKGGDSWASGKYPRLLFYGTNSRIQPIANKVMILRKSEDVFSDYNNAIRRRDR